MSSCPLGYPLEPGHEAAPTGAALQEDGLDALKLRLEGLASITSDVDRLHEICHDMRQPVASILILADAALSEASIPSPVRASLGHVREQAEWLGDLLQDVLEPDGASTADGKAHDLTRIASDAVQAAQATYRGDLHLQWSTGDMSVLGSAIDLRRAIGNVVSNATRAAGPDGTVVVELDSAGDHVLLSVDDDGPGFGLIRREIGLGLRAAARGLKSYGGRIEFGRSRTGGTRVVLVLRALAPPDYWRDDASRTLRRSPDSG